MNKSCKWQKDSIWRPWQVFGHSVDRPIAINNCHYCQKHFRTMPPLSLTSLIWSNVIAKEWIKEATSASFAASFWHPLWQPYLVQFIELKSTQSDRLSFWLLLNFHILIYLLHYAHSCLNLLQNVHATSALQTNNNKENGSGRCWWCVSTYFQLVAFVFMCLCTLSTNKPTVF